MFFSNKKRFIVQCIDPLSHFEIVHRESTPERAAKKAARTLLRSREHKKIVLNVKTELGENYQYTYYNSGFCKSA